MRRLSPTRRAVAGSIATAVSFQAVLVVSGVLAARLLGVEDRGHLALLLLIPGLLSQIGGLGLPLSVTYHIAREPSAARTIVRSVARSAVIQGFVLTLVHATILALLLAGESREVRTAGLLTLPLVPGLLAFEYGLAILQGEHRFRSFNILKLLPQTLYSAAVLGLFLTGSGPLAAVVVAAVVPSVVLGAAAVVLALRRLPPAADPGAGAPTPRALLRFGLKGLLGAAWPSESFRVDQIAVGLLLPPEALGLYVVGLAFTNLPRFIAQGIGTVAYPHVAGRRSQRDARQSMWRLFGFTVALCAAVVAALEGVAGVIVPLFFGREFEDAVPIARIVLVGALFLSARRILTESARGAGHLHLGTIGEAVSWSVLVPAVAILAPSAGAEGVAWALTLSSGLSLAAILAAVVASSPKAAAGRLDAAEEEAVAAAAGSAPPAPTG